MIIYELLINEGAATLSPLNSPLSTENYALKKASAAPSAVQNSAWAGMWNFTP